MRRLLCLFLGHVGHDIVSTLEFGVGSKAILKNCILFECARCGAPVAVRSEMQDTSIMSEAIARNAVEGGRVKV